MPILRSLACAAVLTGGCGGGKQTRIEGPPLPVGEAVPLPPAAGSDSGVGSGFKPGPGGFPVPSDADAGKPVGADNTGYDIARSKDAVYAQLRPELEKLGFKIESYIPQPKAHRLIMYKDSYKFIATISETGAAGCTLVITVSPTDK